MSSTEFKTFSYLIIFLFFLVDYLKLFIFFLTLPSLLKIAYIFLAVEYLISSCIAA